MRSRSIRRTAVLAAAAGLLGALLQAVPAAAAPAAPAAPVAPVAPDLATGGVRAPVPVLTWADCSDELGPGIECATAMVPLDYDRPDGETIELALARDPADDPARRIGSLFVNPGGPGVSGVEVVPAIPFIVEPEVTARFDVIGVDPRGVARSAPVLCFADHTEQDEFYAAQPPFPVGTEIPAWLRLYKAYTDSCARNAGPVIDHVSTANFVRDLDLLRQAVGDPGFTFLGYSYGTQVASTYAAMFPRRVRALVLDGVLDPVAWSTGTGAEGALVPVSTRIKSAQGASETLGAFFRKCAAGGPDACALADPGASAAALSRKYDRLARALLQRPVALPQEDGTTLDLTYALLVVTTLGELYDPATWPSLAELLQAAYEARLGPATGAATARSTASAQLAAVRARFAEDEEPVYDSGFDAVTCADSVNPRSPLAWPVNAALQDARFPYFGSPWTYSTQACATWPGHDSDRYLGPYDKRTAKPVLVVGTRYDPATRYQNAQAVARRLPGARLLTLDGYGHTSLFSSDCIDGYTADYLLTGALPAAGTVCEPDAQPFDPSPAARNAAGSMRAKVVGGSLPPTMRAALAGS